MAICYLGNIYRFPTQENALNIMVSQNEIDSKPIHIKDEYLVYLRNEFHAPLLFLFSRFCPLQTNETLEIPLFCSIHLFL